jgi:glycosyltransferase involved in cell wall biosynthesis
MRIALIGANYNLWAPLTPDKLFRPGGMVGGGETSMICVSQELARLGHSVTVYAHTPQAAEYDGVQWIPLRGDGEFREKPESVDVAVSYDNPSILRDINCHVRVLENQTNNPPIRDVPEGLIDAFVFKSHWHKNAVRQVEPSLALERSFVVGNGVDPSLYAKRNEVAKVPGRMIWSSSPDRGLHHALEIFRRVRERMANVTFHVFYNFDNCFEPYKWGMNYGIECMWRAKRLMETTEGVTHVGAVNKHALAQAQMEAELLLFPEDTARPSEGFGISVLEALTAGCVPLISDCDCMPELWGGVAPMLPLPIRYDLWTEAVVKLLSDRESREARAKAGYELAEQYTWERIGRQWHDLLTGLYAEKPCPYCGKRLGPEPEPRTDKEGA